MIGLSDVQVMFVSAAIGATFIFIVGGVAWLIQGRRNAPMAKAVPLDDLMDGPVEHGNCDCVGDCKYAVGGGQHCGDPLCTWCAVPAEQVGDDTLAMVADMWDSFEEANVHGIEVDDTAAEADMVNANGPAVLTEERALVAAIDAWRRDTDLEAWLGERGWL